MEFLHSFLSDHFAGKPVVVLQNVGCFLRLLAKYNLQSLWLLLTGAYEPPSYNSSLQKLSATANRTQQYARHFNGATLSPQRSPEERSPEFNGNSHLTVEQQSVSSEVTNDSGLPTDRHSTSSSPTFDHPGELQSIQIRYSTGLGLCVVGGTNRPDGPHVYIDDIIEGGDAHKVGLLISGCIFSTLISIHFLWLS